MSTPVTLQVDTKTIESYVDALFRYAEPGTYASLRAFFENGNGVFKIEAHQIGDDLRGLSLAAVSLATRAAQSTKPVVFCPPVATFKIAYSAKEIDLANGLVLSIECDTTPNAAREKLESILWPATVVVASGGQWVDPETGEVQAKLHLHWRLTEATTTPAAHAQLKLARTLAAQLVGGDPTNAPIEHPIRMPGSWHRKKEPRLAQIVAIDANREIELHDALERLQEAVKAVGTARLSPQGQQAAPMAAGEPRMTNELVSAILSADEYHRPLVSLAMRFLIGGTPDAQVVEILRGIMLAVSIAKRDIKHGVHQPGRWQSRFDDIPRFVASARAKIGEHSTQGEADWPIPVDFIGDTELTGAPDLQPSHLPDAIAGFVFDTADRMGIDPAAVALCAVVACASVISDSWKIQPKVHDDTWTEQPRLWGAVVGDPSIRKTPILRACTRPIDELEEVARKRHAEAMAAHRAVVGRLKAEKVPPEQHPAAPRLERYLVEGTTIEALSEILRDDEDAKHRAPAGKVLLRQDELSEWLASFDAYKGGGRQSADRGAYLRLYNGGRFTVDRVGRGNFAIPNWSGCVLGGIQPEPIQRIAREASDDGLLQRFLYVVPTAEREGQDRKPNAAALDRYSALFPALALLTPPTSSDARFVVRLAADGQPYRQAIEGLAKAQAALPDTSARLKATFGKWPGVFPRLALIFHLITIADAKTRGATPPPDGTLSANTANKAASFMQDVLLPHLLRAEGLLFLSKQTGHACWIAHFILSNEKIRTTLRVEVRDVQRAYKALKAPEHRDQLIAALQALETCGWLRAEGADNNARRISSWRVNPILYTIFAAKAETERERRRQVREEILKTIGRNG